MEKEFISYELALKLKELGFNDECLRTYDNNGNFCNKITQRLYCKAPLWQQAFDWFRNEYNLHIIIDANINNRGYIPCVVNQNNSIYHNIDNRFKTYEEARLECLNKLIQLANEI